MRSVSRKLTRVLGLLFGSTLAVATASAAPTWQVQSDYRGTRDVVSQPRSLRGLALAPDDLQIYGGFIQGSTSSAIREVSTAIIPGTITVGSGNITNVADLLGPQPKG